MSDAVRRARHRDVGASRARTAARRGVHALVLTVIAGGTVAFAGTTVPEPTVPDATVSAEAAGELSAVERARFIASRFESRSPLEGIAVELVVDGQAQQLTTQAATVAELLTEAGVLVDEDDVVSAPLSFSLTAGATVEVTTVDVVDQHVTDTDEHAIVEEEDDSLPRGEREVVTEGVDGVTATTYRVTTTGGEETAREVVARAVVSERVDEVVRVGTAEPVVAAPSTPSAPSASVPAAPVPAGGSKAIAAEMVAARGWGTDQYSCLETLWQRESGWNHLAQNPSSGAYGIPQSLPGSKMASAGADWRTNPATQITWGLGYISDRYGTPCAALGHSNSRGWY